MFLTYDGEVVRVELHLYWERRIFSISKLKGYMIVGDQYFNSPYGYCWDGKYNDAAARSMQPNNWKETWEIKRDEICPGGRQGKLTYRHSYVGYFLLFWGERQIF